MLLKKWVAFAFTPAHMEAVQSLLARLSRPDVLAFRDYEAVTSGAQPLCSITDASFDGLGEAIEQEQADGTVRLFCSLSTATLPDECEWPVTELGCAAVIHAIKHSHKPFYGIPFVIESDHQPLTNLASLAEKVNRVQHWFEFLRAYKYKLGYRPGKASSNADLMSRLPLPACLR